MEEKVKDTRKEAERVKVHELSNLCLGKPGRGEGEREKEKREGKNKSHDLRWRKERVSAPFSPFFPCLHTVYLLCSIPFKVALLP